MLCVTLQSYTRTCGALSGGISDIFFFDPSDFNFTQTTPTSGYSAVARRTGATGAGGANFFPVSFQEDQANRAWAQSINGCSVKYEHTITFQTPQLSNALTNFLQALDAAGCCCGLGMIIVQNDTKIFVAGEKYVNGSQITKFTLKQNGSTGDSGKLFEDFNGATVVMKGNYSRDLREFTGSRSAIEAFQAGGSGGTPTTFDTDLDVSAGVSANADDVTITAAAINANIAFSFNAINPTEGLPLSMSIREGGVEKLTVDYLDDYEGEAFQYTDSAGVVHPGTFAEGNVDF